MIGEEFYIVPSYDVEEQKELKKRFHLVAIAKNKTGFETLTQLNTISWEHFYYKPILSKEEIFKLPPAKLKNIIWTTACVQNDISFMIINEEIEKAEQTLLEYDKYLNNEKRTGFYLEIQPFHDENYKKVLDLYIEWSKKYNIKINIGTDSHYTYQSEAFFHKFFVLNSFKKKKNIFDDLGDYFKESNLYLYKLEDIYREFEGLVPKEIIEEGIKNNYEIYKSISKYDFNWKEPQIPKPFSLKKSENVDKELIKRCTSSMVEKGIDTKQYHKVLREELEVIIPNKYSQYFLLLQDICEFARNKYGKYVISPSGRGSAGGSLVAFLLGITGIDPIKYDLSFPRFLNNFRAKQNIVKFFDE